MRFTCLCVGILLACSTFSPAADDGWVQLFNGKDLTGWKIHPKPSGDVVEVITVEKDGKIVGFDAKMKNGKIEHLWRVDNGVLIGGGPASHLFSEKGDYINFHYRVEAKINDKGNSGQYFRTAFGPGFPNGYEAQINATHGDKIKTGSLYKLSNVDMANHKPDEFFTQEVIANGDEITIIVNGKTTVDKLKNGKFKTGHFALQGHDPGSIMTFKKVEVKEIK